MSDGGPGFATETLTYIIYKVAFGQMRQGYGTALAVVLFFIILILAVLQVRILRSREVQL
jgi:ABC-type sugar transport system permease subunit